MQTVLVTDFGQWAYRPPYPVRFRKDGWPDRRFAQASFVANDMIAAMQAAKEWWLANG